MKTKEKLTFASGGIAALILILGIVFASFFLILLGIGVCLVVMGIFAPTKWYNKVVMLMISLVFFVLAFILGG